MADPNIEKINQEVENTGELNQGESELSDSDVEKVAGGGHHNTLVSGTATCG
jgi:hypothetical protein